jgi:hypothetical protein
MTASAVKALKGFKWQGLIDSELSQSGNQRPSKLEDMEKPWVSYAIQTIERNKLNPVAMNVTIFS